MFPRDKVTLGHFININKNKNKERKSTQAHTGIHRHPQALLQTPTHSCALLHAPTPPRTPSTLGKYPPQKMHPYRISIPSLSYPIPSPRIPSPISTQNGKIYSAKTHLSTTPIYYSPLLSSPLYLRPRPQRSTITVHNDIYHHHHIVFSPSAATDLPLISPCARTPTHFQISHSILASFLFSLPSFHIPMDVHHLLSVHPANSDHHPKFSAISGTPSETRAQTENAGLVSPLSMISKYRSLMFC